MKKKFINGLLLAALFVGFTGSMVSCKDYDDDKIGNLEGIIADNEASLRAALDAQKAALEAQIKTLSDQLAACQKTCSDFRTQIYNDLNKYLTIVAFNQFKDELGNTYYTKTQIDNKFYTKEEVDAMMKKFNNIYTKDEVDALLKSIKDAITAEALANAVAQQLQAGNTTLQNALTQYFTTNPTILEFIKKNTGIDEEAVKKIVNEALVEVNKAISEAAANAKTALDLANQNKTLIEGLTKDLTALSGKFDNLNTTVENLNKTVETLNNTITTLQGSVTTLQGQVIGLETKIGEVLVTANEAKALAEANKAKIESLEDSYSQLAERVSKAEGDITAIKLLIEASQKDITALNEKVDKALEEAEAKHKEMLQTIAGLASAIEANTNTIGQLKQDFIAYQETVAILLGYIQQEINDVIEDVKANKTEIDRLAGLFKNALAQYISGVEINGTNNQLFGAFATPFGIRSNVLTAFHGQFGTRGVEFPTTDDAFYALPEASEWNKIDDIDLLMLNNGAYFDANNTPGFISEDYDKEIVAQDGKIGNAGTLYVTINPATTDFSGTEFQLYNSQNKQADVTLSPLTKSNELLTMGYTRANTGNGFYEVKATVDEATVKNLRMNLDMSSLKPVANAIKNSKERIPVLNIVTTVYKSLQDVMPALAAKATWTDDLGETRSYVSQYDLAAVAIKPLAFAFAKDINLKDEIETRVEDLLDNILDRVFVAFPSLHTNRFSIDHIEVDGLTEDLRAKFHIYLGERFIVSSGPKSVTISLPNITLTGTNGHVYTLTANDPVVTVGIEGNDAEITVEFNVAEIVEHMSNYDSEPEINILKQLKAFVDDVNKFIDELSDINAETIEGNVYEQLVGYFESLTTRAHRVLNINRFMQPVALAKTSKGYIRLNESINYPSRITETNFLLAPTTFNAEVLSPAYKKFVAVTDVYKDGSHAKGGNIACKAILDQANSQPQMKQVIDGGQSHFIDFKGEKGCTYEILYSALDYHGKVSTKKFYVTIAQ